MLSWKWSGRNPCGVCLSAVRPAHFSVPDAGRDAARWRTVHRTYPLILLLTGVVLNVFLSPPLLPIEGTKAWLPGTLPGVRTMIRAIPLGERRRACRSAENFRMPG